MILRVYEQIITITIPSEVGTGRGMQMGLPGAQTCATAGTVIIMIRAKITAFINDIPIGYKQTTV